MGNLLAQIQALAAAGEIILSQHAYDRLRVHAIPGAEIEAGIAVAVEIEEYPEYHKGPSVLVLQQDADGQPIHVLWGIRLGTTTPAVVDHGLSSRSVTLDARFQEAPMRARKTTQFVHEGRYAAEVEIELLEEDREWAPYLSMADVKKLDAVRLALQKGDLAAAGRLARVYELKRVAAE